MHYTGLHEPFWGRLFGSCPKARLAVGLGFRLGVELRADDWLTVKGLSNPIMV